MEQTVGDWVIFYEPRANGGRMVYHSAQRVETIVPDPVEDGHYFAILDVGSELSFDRAVPRVLDGHVFESRLRGVDGHPISGGSAQSAVRLVPDEDFDAILRQAFTTDPVALGVDQSAETIDGFAEPLAEFDRPIMQQLLNRPFRAAAFSRQVKRAYGNRCAISGLAIRNGGGRPEVQAAHIKPVADGGPDTVRNGLALSGTVHWMFDRHLLTIDEDCRTILIAKDRLPDTAERLIVPDRKLLLPHDNHTRPHPAYLSYHREKFLG